MTLESIPLSSRLQSDRFLQTEPLVSGKSEMAYSVSDDIIYNIHKVWGMQ
jgi:hypothetical protein